jgi:hypothetical protein
MGKSLQKYRGPMAGEILSLNIEDLDVVELERRLEMVVALAGFCGINKTCSCDALSSCGTFCS